MSDPKKDFIIAIEALVLQALNRNEGRSNTRTSVLHGAIEKYIDLRCKIKWEHEETITGRGQNFKIDMLGKHGPNHLAILIKAPVRSMGKNKKNSLVNTWGEAVRVSVIKENETHKMKVLFIQVYPTIDIIVNRIRTEGQGRTEFKKYTPDTAEIYNTGLDKVVSSNTQFKYAGVPYDYTIPHTLKSLDGVLHAFQAQEAGQRISISEETWKEFDSAIDWLFLP
ncbi:MAG: hypothetical protein GDA52_00685 [Rhodobacteraceae bacterium]|nr:hypothetical protein [Paracoccaceae bacterium]